MDNTAQTTAFGAPADNDQALAEALASVTREIEDNATPIVSSDLQPEEVPISTVPGAIPASDSALNTPAPVASAPLETPGLATPAPVAAPAADGDLEAIKQAALQELRPIIDRVDLPVEEKFDTYLLLLRSTDDKTLIAPAHAVAQNIADENRRAQALLEIIKEIDFLSGGDKPSI